MFRSEHEMREAGTWDESAQTTTDTICPYCGVGCTLSLHVQDNEIVKVTSPMDSSVTDGHLCVKGRFGFAFVQERRAQADRRTGRRQPLPEPPAWRLSGSIEAFADTAAFRSWLAEHHATSPGIWLKIGKKNSGLVDDEPRRGARGRPRLRLDRRPGPAGRRGVLARRASPGEHPGAPGRSATVDNAERLIAAGRMEPAGQAEVDRAKADGRWARAYDGQRDIQEPADLVAALADNAARRRLLRDQPHEPYAIQDRVNAETRANRIA